jgi:hypothetical protein
MIHKTSVSSKLDDFYFCRSGVVALLFVMFVVSWLIDLFIVFVDHDIVLNFQIVFRNGILFIILKPRMGSRPAL